LKTINLIPEQVDQIIIDELKLIAVLEKQGFPKLSEASHTLLQYFMPRIDYDKWCKEIDEETR
jgi:hypothetical protein